MILGIELSSSKGGLALVKKGKIIGEKSLKGSLQHDKHFTTVLKNLLSKHHLSTEDINAIGVSIGPGSFTGIRLGIAAAYGLALKNNTPLFGIPTMESLLFNESLNLSPKNISKILTPTIQAKKDHFYTGFYKIGKNGNFRTLKKPFLITQKDFLNQITPDHYIFGIGIETLKDNLNGIQCKKIFPKAASTALLAEKKLKEKNQRKKIRPIYIWEFRPSPKKQFTR